MFEMIFILLFLAFMVVFLMLCKKLRAHFEKVEEQNHSKLIALVNIGEELKHLNVNLVNFEMNGEFNK